MPRLAREVHRRGVGEHAVSTHVMNARSALRVSSCAGVPAIVSVACAGRRVFPTAKFRAIVPSNALKVSPAAGPSQRHTGRTRRGCDGVGARRWKGARSIWGRVVRRAPSSVVRAAAASVPRPGLLPLLLSGGHADGDVEARRADIRGECGCIDRTSPTDKPPNIPMRPPGRVHILQARRHGSRLLSFGDASPTGVVTFGGPGLATVRGRTIR